MNCPVCDARLRTIQKYNVELEICPDCKGIWLDRGELEKIVDMAESGGPGQQEDIKRTEERRPNDDDRNREKHHDEDHNYKTQKKKQRGAWLSDILGGFGED